MARRQDRHMHALRFNPPVHVLRTNSQISYSQETPASPVDSLLDSGSWGKGNSISWMLDFFFFVVKAVSYSGIFLPFPLIEENAG